MIGKLLDSIIMNFGKVDSTSLSEEESDLTNTFEFFICKGSHECFVFHWSYAPPPTMESNLC